MRAVTALDHGDLSRLPPPDAEGTLPPLPPSRTPTAATASPTGSYAVDYTGEAVLSLLRFASQILARAVVFAVEGDTARGVGEFGVQLPEAGPGPRRCARPSSPSASRPSCAPPSSAAGPTPAPSSPRGSTWPSWSAWAGPPSARRSRSPSLVGGEVRFVLYADNAPSGRPLGPLDTLESSAARAARIIEKTLAARS